VASRRLALWGSVRRGSCCESHRFDGRGKMLVKAYEKPCAAHLAATQRAVDLCVALALGKREDFVRLWRNEDAARQRVRC